MVLTPPEALLNLLSLPDFISGKGDLVRFGGVICLVLALVPRGGEGAAKVGFVLLREGVGARAAAMGEAYTAVVGDQAGSFWNPAGVAALRGKDFLATHHRSLQGLQQTYAGWAYGNGIRGIGLSLGIHSLGGLETRTGPTAEPLGRFSLFEVNTGLTVSQRFKERMYAGVNVRLLHEAIGSDTASGFAVDLGLIYRTPIDGLTVGAAQRNWGRTTRLGRERVPLPRTVRLGAAVARGRVSGSADLRFPKGGERGVNLGVEYSHREMIFLRAGYRSGSETRDLSYGFGIRRGNWRISYAFVPTSLGFGGSHRLGVGIR